MSFSAMIRKKDTYLISTWLLTILEPGVMKTLTAYTNVLKRPTRVGGSVKNVLKSFELLKS